MSAGMINISSTHTVDQTVSSCKYIMRRQEAILVMSTIGRDSNILSTVERYAKYEKIGNPELGIRGRHDAQVMKKLIMTLPNDLELPVVKEKLEVFLENSGIGKFPYLLCVHRGEKDGIVNRHVHINFFQRRFEKGNSNKERLFVQKAFAEDVRAKYQEVFGFTKNRKERVRVPRPQFEKFKENREAIRVLSKREEVLNVELKQLQPVAVQEIRNEQVFPVENGEVKAEPVVMSGTDLPVVGQEPTQEEAVNVGAKNLGLDLDIPAETVEKPEEVDRSKLSGKDRLEHDISRILTSASQEKGKISLQEVKQRLGSEGIEIKLLSSVEGVLLGAYYVQKSGTGKEVKINCSAVDKSLTLTKLLNDHIEINGEINSLLPSSGTSLKQELKSIGDQTSDILFSDLKNKAWSQHQMMDDLAKIMTLGLFETITVKNK